MLIVKFDGLPSWYLDVSENGDSTKYLWVGVVEGITAINPTASTHAHGKNRGL